MGRPRKNIEKNTSEEPEKKKNTTEDYYIDASYILERKADVFSISPSLDILLGGGIRDGSISVIGGNPGLGKTSYGLGVIASAQKKGRKGIYINIEERIEYGLLQMIPGLDLSSENFKIITSREGDILTAEDYLERTEKILIEFPRSVVLFDSVSDLSTKAEKTDDYGDGFGVQARKLESLFCRRILPTITVNRNAFMAIAHTNSSMQGGTHEKISREMFYKSNLIIRCTRPKEDFEIKSKDMVVGHRVQWEVIKNSYGPPKQKTITHFRYNEGPDYISDMLDQAINLSVIEKSGSWLKIPGIEKQIQGVESAREFLKQNPAKYDEIAQSIKEIFDEN